MAAMAAADGQAGILLSSKAAFDIHVIRKIRLIYNGFKPIGIYLWPLGELLLFAAATAAATSLGCRGFPLVAHTATVWLESRFLTWLMRFQKLQTGIMKYRRQHALPANCAKSI
jgi:hypothetical protein